MAEFNIVLVCELANLLKIMIVKFGTI